ncbi:MAG: 4Fe-4S binding protein [Clostridiales bacterium]|nr:4Fe-4S binding protein [Clostridiales bacterium]
MGTKDKPAPAWLESGWAAWAALAVTAGLFILSRRVLGRDLPVMLFWMVAGFLITLVFHPDVFHDLLCPYGVLQRIMAKLSFLSPEGRETARNYQGFTKSVLGGGNQPGDGKPQA